MNSVCLFLLQVYLEVGGETPLNHILRLYNPHVMGLRRKKKKEKKSLNLCSHVSSLGEPLRVIVEDQPSAAGFDYKMLEGTRPPGIF
jgi:hypothetical protein